MQTSYLKPGYTELQLENTKFYDDNVEDATSFQPSSTSNDDPDHELLSIGCRLPAEAFDGKWKKKGSSEN